MKKFISGLTLLTVVLLLASCQDDFFDFGKNDAKLTKGQIAFTIGSDQTATRAEVSRTVVAPTNVIELASDKEGTSGFCLVETVSQLGEETFDTYSGAVTRGTPVYTENFDAVFGGFVGTPYGLNESEYVVWGGEPRVNFAKLNSANNMYMHDFGELEWPSSKELLFFLEAPTNIGDYTSNVARSSDGSMEFDYTSPTDPKAQQDILFTSKTITEETKNTDNKITFYHALTAVKFKLGYNTTHDVKVSINKITFHNYPSTGHCKVIPQDGAKSSACVTWTNLGNPESFTIDFRNIVDENGNPVTGDAVYKNADGTVKKDNQGNPIVDPNVPGLIDGTTEWGDDRTYFPDSFFGNSTSTSGPYKGESTADRNFNNKNFEYTFMFIPHQEASEDSYIEIDFTYTYTQETGSSSYMPSVPHQNVSRVSLPSIANTWLPGELHTYILTSEGVDILVEDKMEGDWKSSVEVVNTGTYPEFQRALLCANWVWTDESTDPATHLIVASADYRADGKFCTEQNEASLGGFPGENWVQGTDSFFYYKNPINVGNKPNTPLFEYYKGPEYTTFNGTHLELAISTQAIRYSPTNVDYNKEFVRAQWNLDNVYVVNQATGQQTTQTIAQWMGLTGETQPEIEVYTGDPYDPNN